jgi:hypothetical protein
MHFDMSDGISRIAAVHMKLIRELYKKLSAMIEEEDTK